MLRKEQEETEHDPIQKINETIDYIAPRIGKTQKELLKLKPDEISRLFISTEKYLFTKEREREKTFLKAVVRRNLSSDDYIKRIEEIDKEIDEINKKEIEPKRKIEQIEGTNVFQFNI